jgi:hypothetical protein
VGAACSTHRGNKKYIQNFGRKPERKDHEEDIGVDGSIIFIMDLREIRFEIMDWIHLAQDREKWRALVKSVMNLRVP